MFLIHSKESVHKIFFLVNQTRVMLYSMFACNKKGFSCYYFAVQDVFIHICLYLIHQWTLLQSSSGNTDTRNLLAWNIMKQLQGLNKVLSIVFGLNNEVQQNSVGRTQCYFTCIKNVIYLSPRLHNYNGVALPHSVWPGKGYSFIQEISHPYLRLTQRSPGVTVRRSPHNPNKRKCG